MYDIAQSVMYCVISFSFLVFFLLDGFDLGIGMILPFFPRADSGHKRLLDLVWPFWDGNELWAIIGGTLLFAAFPSAFVAIIGSFAPVVTLLFTVLMFRPISFEAWYGDKNNRKLWEIVQAAGSFLLAFGLGFIAGTLLEGMPLTANGGIEGAPFSAFRPFAFLAGFLSVSASLLEGLLFIRKKTDGPVRRTGAAYARILMPIVFALSALVLIVVLLIVPETSSKPAFWAALLAAVASALFLFFSGTKKGDNAPFYGFVSGTVFVWIALTIALFPYLLRPAGGGQGLYIAISASPASTMKFLVICVPIALTIVTVYSVFIYRVFRGKSKPLEY